MSVELTSGIVFRSLVNAIKKNFFFSDGSDELQ